MRILFAELILSAIRIYLLEYVHALGEPLEMYHLTFTQEPERGKILLAVGLVHYMLVRRPCLLFSRKIFINIRDRVAR